MLRAIYVLNSDFRNEDFKQKLLEKLSSTYKKIVTFLPIGENNVKNSNTIFEENQAKLYLLDSKQNELIKNVITEFDKIDADFIIVVGGFIETLDDSLARNLNAPFLLSKDTKFKKGTLNFTVLNDIEEIFSTNSNAMTSLRFENLLYKKARSNLKTVVLPESDDERILKASAILLENKAVNIVLLGDKHQINKKARQYGLNLENIKVYDPQNSDLSDEFATTLYELRREKGMTKEKASELMKDRTYFGTMLVYKGICDAMVSGASTTTAETIRPALQFIKMKPGISTVSGSFIMCLDTKIQLFADCAITPNPTADQLASIAISTAKTARDFGLEPKVAMLSYSTGSSGSGEDVKFVETATQKAKALAPNLDIEGPIQFDAAVDLGVAKKKLPNSKVAGVANTFIFPNLNCGNITYKAVQRSANAVAIGPILQGLNKPVNDLSRGCSVEDIVNTVLISAIQSQGENI